MAKQEKKTEAKNADHSKLKNAEALAKAEPAAVVTSELAEMFTADAAAGQAFAKEDIAIPRLVILQALSPQCTRGQAEFIPEAKPGDIFDTVNSTLYDPEEGVTVIPVSYRRAYLEWTLREDGGGFVKDWGLDSSRLEATEKDEKNRQITPDGSEVITTAEYFVLLVVEGIDSGIPMVLSMSKTQLKHSRKWNTFIQQLQVKGADGKSFNPAMFFRSYTLRTMPESNDQGSWFSWDVKPGKNTVDLPNGPELYLQARQLREMVAVGAVKAAPPVAPTSDGDPDTM